MTSKGKAPKGQNFSRAHYVRSWLFVPNQKSWLLPCIIMWTDTKHCAAGWIDRTGAKTAVMQRRQCSTWFHALRRSITATDGRDATRRLPSSSPALVETLTDLVAASRLPWRADVGDEMGGARRWRQAVWSDCCWCRVNGNGQAVGGVTAFWRRRACSRFTQRHLHSKPRLLIVCICNNNNKDNFQRPSAMDTQIEISQVSVLFGLIINVFFRSQIVGGIKKLK